MACHEPQRLSCARSALPDLMGGGEAVIAPGMIMPIFGHQFSLLDCQRWTYITAKYNMRITCSLSRCQFI